MRYTRLKVEKLLQTSPREHKPQTQSTVEDVDNIEELPGGARILAKYSKVSGSGGGDLTCQDEAKCLS